jgi:hypothetical protein
MLWEKVENMQYLPQHCDGGRSSIWPPGYSAVGYNILAHQVEQLYSKKKISWKAMNKYLHSTNP